jgi:hypothetical protein
MAWIDVCNGDADGLFALVQLRLADPVPAQLVTGLKHDIELLERVVALDGDQVTVCDISMRRNAGPLARLLSAGVRVRYFDHHESGPIPDHPGLESHVDLTSDICTSLIVDQHLGGRFSAWAAAAAWGDNLAASAVRVADRLRLGAEERAALRELGEAVNYNAYGETPADPLIAPDALFKRLAAYADPLDAWCGVPLLAEMARRRRADLEEAHAMSPTVADHLVRMWVLPDEPWSRRVVGPFANEVAAEDPARAHAVARLRADGRYDVSVRAPLALRAGADRLCRAFGGGGRAAAAAADGLSAADLERFVLAFRQTQWGAPTAAGRTHGD